MCDISDSESLKNALEWIDQVYARSPIYDRVIAVFANKCDLLEEQDHLEFDLESALAEKCDDIMYEEVSV